MPDISTNNSSLPTGVELGGNSVPAGLKTEPTGASPSEAQGYNPLVNPLDLITPEALTGAPEQAESPAPTSKEQQIAAHQAELSRLLEQQQQRQDEQERQRALAVIEAAKERVQSAGTSGQELTSALEKKQKEIAELGDVNHTTNNFLDTLAGKKHEEAIALAKKQDRAPAIARGELGDEKGQNFNVG